MLGSFRPGIGGLLRVGFGGGVDGRRCAGANAASGGGGLEGARGGCGVGGSGRLPRPLDVERFPAGGGALLLRRKNGSSSAMELSARGGPPPRDSKSSGPIWRWLMPFCRSRNDVYTSSRPLVVRTTQRSGPLGLPAGWTLNWCPQFVHFTVVPRSLTRASSNSYSVPQREQLTSIEVLGGLLCSVHAHRASSGRTA